MSPNEARVVTGRTAPLHDSHAAKPALNVLATLGRHPELYEPTIALGRAMVAGRLPARDRELAVLRVAVRCRAQYVWAHHYHLGRIAGVTDAELAGVGAVPGEWTGKELALLTAVDELAARSTVSDGTWAALSEHYDEVALIELVSVIGEYHKISFLMNACGTPVDDWVSECPELPMVPQP